ncbi:uncharacterized protein LOC116350966 [Contarinia nasturtii]|uniref:uncharacterized protein LOC116350966 n=1 Tax=Contarinia nasturtii TaxID=265458 RepID=UPI0012D38D2F|nr:uncharacterized protein LOC116350966 [Contarinia nasturtii]
MKACAIVSVLYFISLVSALPARNGMLYYNMPYYHPYHQAMFVHYAPSQYGRSAGSTSAFALGDSIAAGTVVRENQVPAEDVPHAVAQEQSSNDGNVEAIAEAYPEVPIQGTVQFDQGEDQYNEVVPLNVVPAVSETLNDSTENIAPVVPLAPFTPEPESKVIAAEEPQVQVQPTTAPETPKKKVHIALDIPEKHDENEYDVEDDDQYVPQKPGKPLRNGGSPVYTFFPVSFGRAAGGTIAVANAYSTGKGAVRSHAIAYGSNGTSRRQQSTERHTAV